MNHAQDLNKTFFYTYLTYGMKILLNEVNALVFKVVWVMLLKLTDWSTLQ